MHPHEFLRIEMRRRIDSEPKLRDLPDDKKNKYIDRGMTMYLQNITGRGEDTVRELIKIMKREVSNAEAKAVQK